MTWNKLRQYKLWVALALTILTVAIVVFAIPFIYLSGVREVEEVIIPANGYELRGYYAKGTASDGPWVVLVHGNRQSGQNNPLYQQIVHHLERQTSVLGLDLSGFGQSSPAGLSQNESFFDRSPDVEAAINYLIEQKGARQERIVLVGHSLGAAQVLKVAQTRRYQRVIPIGLGDYTVYLDNQRLLESYVDKFGASTGVRVSNEMMFNSVSQFTPESLFSPCPETPTVLVFGGLDHADTLIHQRERLDNLCTDELRWITVPFADHMYGTENTRLPDPLEPFYSRSVLTVLIWQLNQLIREPAD